MDHVIEFAQVYLSHKNPQIRVETIAWMTRSISRSSTIAPTRKLIKVIAELLMPLMDDSLCEVRDSAAEFLAKLYTKAGEQNVVPFLDKLDKLRLAKISDKITHSSDSKKSAVNTGKNTELNASAPISELSTNRHVPSSPKKVVIDASLSKVPAVIFKYSDDEADIFFRSFLPQNVLNNLEDASWKVRMEAMDSFLSYLNGENSSSRFEGELLIRFLSQKPGWKESNFQVLSKMFLVVEAYADKNLISAEASALLVPGIFFLTRCKKLLFSSC